MNIEDMDYTDPETVEDINKKKKVANNIACSSIRDKDFLSEEETKWYLNVGSGTLRKWVADGLVVIRIGGRKFYWKKDIENFMIPYRDDIKPYQARRR